LTADTQTLAANAPYGFNSKPKT